MINTKSYVRYFHCQVWFWSRVGRCKALEWTRKVRSIFSHFVRRDTSDPSKMVQLQTTRIVFNTLAARGLEELFFQLCCCVSFWFSREIGSGFTYVCVLRVQYSCGLVLVFWFWQEIVFGVTCILSVQYSCVVVSVFWLWQEIVLNMRHVSSKKSYWVTLL
jgi:hypothetical protein